MRPNWSKFSKRIAYIDGQWIAARADDARLALLDARTEQPIDSFPLADAAIAERAVCAAHAAFDAFASLSLDMRLEMLAAMRDAYSARCEEMGHAISREMGAPLDFSLAEQASVGLAHLDATLEAARQVDWQTSLGHTVVCREPIGVASLITPWNWPANQIACKVGPAIAAGCTMVLKPSEYAPYSAQLFAEIVCDAGLPAGVFNLVQGTGETVGSVLASHPLVDMVTFTGSHRAGVAISMAAAPTVKRVVQELGGKSANIILDDLDQSEFSQAVEGGLAGCFLNSGQSCDAPSRMLVPAHRLEEAEQIAEKYTKQLTVGPAPSDDVGPVVNAKQYEAIQDLLVKAVAEGGRCVAGGPGRHDSQSAGYYVRPTVISGIDQQSTIAREEVFGPVLALLPYETVEQAVEVANDTTYGLSGYISGKDPDAVMRIAKSLRTGMVLLNGAELQVSAPFGGFRQSGNGREWGRHGIEEFLETKAIIGASQ